MVGLFGIVVEAENVQYFTAGLTVQVIVLVIFQNPSVGYYPTATFKKTMV